MHTYDIYGLGAALVDTEITVEDTDLGRFDIDKGVMTVNFQQLDFFQCIDIEPLQRERSLCPGPIQSRHKHAEGELINVDFNLLNTQVNTLPTFSTYIAFKCDYKPSKKNKKQPIQWGSIIGNCPKLFMQTAAMTSH